MRKSALLVTAAAAAGLFAALPAAGAVRINEFNSDSFNTPTTDYLEYIELYSDTGATTDLSGLSLLLINGNGDVVYGGALDLDGLSTSSLGYAVIGSNAVTAPQVINTSLLGAGNILQNGADAIALVQDDASNYPNGTIITSASQPKLVDAVVYATNNAVDGIDIGLLTALGQAVQFDEGDPTPPSDAADLGLSRIPNGLAASPYLLAARTPGEANVPEPAALGAFAAAGAALLARRRRAMK